PTAAAPPPPAEPAAPATTVPLPPPADPTPFIDDPVGRATQQIYSEFPGSQFIFHPPTNPHLIALERPGRCVQRGRGESYGRRMETIPLAFRREIGDPLGLPPVNELLLK